MLGKAFTLHRGASFIATLAIAALLIAPAQAAAPRHVAPHHPIVHHPVARHPATHPVKVRLVSHAAPKRVVHHVSAERRARAVHHLPAHARLVHTKFVKGSKPRYASSGGISCVPYARAASGITLKGNAANWWDAAAGVYQRGARPEPGAVLNFRATGRMRLGHVAVVARVVNPREVIVDHANWAGPGMRKGMVSKGVPVIDVSPDNSWREVRVGLGHTGDFGSVYPTYGFIYDRPDHGTMLANTFAAPRVEEVAEAPLAPPRSRR